MLLPNRRFVRGAMLVMLLSWCSVARAEERPLLFGVGRYLAIWTGRPWSYDEDCWDHMQTIGATASGAGLAWCDAQPDAPPADYEWDAIYYADHEVAGLVARGLEPTFFLGLTRAPGMQPFPYIGLRNSFVPLLVRPVPYKQGTSTNHSATTMQQILRTRRAKEGKAAENDGKRAGERPEGNLLD